MLKMKGISNIEIKVIADLEFRKKYYFTIDDISSHFVNVKQRYNTIHILQQKGRIIKLNQKKYFLVPIKARYGKWTDYPFIIADEMMDGKGYFIGGWAAANYWRLTGQVPMQIDIWTIKRQGEINLLNSRFVFHRTTPAKLRKAVTEHTKDHSFLVLNKKDAAKWVKGRD